MDAVAHEHGALDLLSVQRAVAIEVDTHLDALSTVLAICARGFGARRDEAVQTVLTVGPRPTIGPWLTVGPRLTVGARLAVLAILTVRDLAAGSVITRDRNDAFVVFLDRARGSGGTLGSSRPRRSVFAPAARDHHHEARERTTDDPRAPNPVPCSHLDESFLIPEAPSSASSGSSRQSTHSTRRDSGKLTRGG
jgi:hypothetical protein